MARFTSDCEGFARRDFLKVGSAGLLGLSLPELLKLMLSEDKINLLLHSLLPDSMFSLCATRTN